MILSVWNCKNAKAGKFLILKLSCSFFQINITIVTVVEIQRPRCFNNNTYNKIHLFFNQ